jgi:phosphoadenylyl-sulfate reductase (thioredoxin)
MSGFPVPPTLPDEPHAVLLTAADLFGDKLVLVSSLGLQSLLALDMLADAGRSVRVAFLDTGRHFDETLAFLDVVEARWNLRIDRLVPVDGAPEPEPDGVACCHARKVAPLAQYLAGRGAWISGIRADQTAERQHADVVGWDDRNGLWKINPFLRWTRHQVADEVRRRDLPVHPLRARGYASIGCAPCTRPSDDERAGRFAGQGRKECGLHVAARANPLTNRLTLTQEHV